MDRLSESALRERLTMAMIEAGYEAAEITLAVPRLAALIQGGEAAPEATAAAATPA